MTIEENYKSKPLICSESSELVCEYCSKSNSTVKCRKNNCFQRIHVYCSLLQKNNFENQEIKGEINRGWQINLQNECNFYGLSLSVLQSGAKKQIKKIFKRLWEIKVKFEENENNQNESKSTRNKKIIKIQKHNVFKEHLKKINKVLQMNIKKICDSFPTIEDIQSCTKDFIEIECQNHQVDTLCISKEPTNKSNFMVSCITCSKKLCF